MNALSSHLEVWVKRDGKEYNMSFADGQKRSELKEIGTVGKRNTGTTVRFWPDKQFFDSTKFNVKSLARLLRAKAVLCPGLTIRFKIENKEEESREWCYEDGLQEYLLGALEGAEVIPAEGFRGHDKTDDAEVEWIACWTSDASEPVAESYVNLIPTPQGGTHTSGLRAGLTEAIREFCEFRDLLPRGVKIAPEDVWMNCQYVLSVRMKDPQFTGQVKDRLASREISAFVSAKVKDACGLWLNQNIAEGEEIALMAVSNAQRRMKAGKKVTRKKITSGPALPGKLADCSSQDLDQTELFLVEGDSAGDPPSRRAAGNSRPSCRCAARY